MKEIILIALVCLSLAGAQQVYGFITGDIDFDEPVDSFFLYLTNDYIKTVQDAQKAGLFFYIEGIQTKGHIDKGKLVVDLKTDSRVTYVVKAPEGIWQVNIGLDIHHFNSGKSAPVEVSPFATTVANVVV